MTRPFEFENGAASARRSWPARLAKAVDTLIVIPNR
jgi:cell division GTPase FtsZ